MSANSPVNTQVRRKSRTQNRERQVHTLLDQVSYFGRVLEINDLLGFLATNTNDPVDGINDAYRVFEDIIHIDNIFIFYQII